MAAELHDHLGQILALTKLNFSRLEDSLEGQFDLYIETCQLLDESCAELRRIAHNMMPPDLASKSLTEILNDLLRKHLVAAGLTYDLRIAQLPVELSMAVKFNLYRMVQEIIHNILKHAKASTVGIELKVSDGKLHLIIRDNGQGFNPQFNTNGLGLRNLHSRANLLGGRLNIESHPQQGSVFHIQLPLS